MVPPINILSSHLKLFVANIGLSQMNWKTVPQLGDCSSDILVLKLILVLVFILFSSQNFYFI